MNSSTTRPHVIVVGSGGKPYREYSFATLAQHYRVSAVLPSEPTWQLRYLSDWTVAELSDPHAIARGHAEMIRRWIWRDFINIILGI